jgi:(2Fe-2S) ferredoxin
MIGRPIDPLSREDFQLMGWKDETYYAPMTPDTITRVVQQHIQKEVVVTEFLGDPTKEPPKT